MKPTRRPNVEAASIAFRCKNGNDKIAIIMAFMSLREAPMAGAGERTRWKDD